MLCIASAGAVLALATGSFTLSWTHSVEKTRWEERWSVQEKTLQLVEASVMGPGAGIAVPPDARWEDGRWTYHATLPAVPELRLAASGMTASPWQLCLEDGSCRILGEQAGADVLIWSESRCVQNSAHP